MSLVKIRNLIKKSKVNIMLIFFVTFILLFGIMITSRVNKTYSLNVGDIAKNDIEATREVTDQNSTDKLKAEASDAVGLQYSKKTDVKPKVIAEINSLFIEALQLKDTNIDENAKLAKLKTDVVINISDDDYKNIVGFSKVDLKNLQQFLVKTMSSLYDLNTIEEDSGDNTEKAKDSYKKATESIANSFNSSSETEKYTKELKSVGINIANAEIKANFIYDKEKTEQQKKMLKKKSLLY